MQSLLQRASLTWYMAYFGMILSVFSVVLRCMNMMATGHRAMMVKMPTKGLIHMAEPVMLSWKGQRNFQVPINVANRGEFETRVKSSQVQLTGACCSFL